jgi:hypothetical protein
MRVREVKDDEESVGCAGNILPSLKMRWIRVYGETFERIRSLAIRVDSQNMAAFLREPAIQLTVQRMTPSGA